MNIASIIHSQSIHNFTAIRQPSNTDLTQGIDHKKPGQALFFIRFMMAGARDSGAADAEGVAPGTPEVGPYNSGVCKIPQRRGKQGIQDGHTTQSHRTLKNPTLDSTLGGYRVPRSVNNRRVSAIGAPSACMIPLHRFKSITMPCPFPGR